MPPPAPQEPTVGTALTTDECWDVLARNTVGRLAVSILNRPDIFPVNYGLDGKSILVNTSPGTKLAAAVSDEAVAFEVDEFDTTARTGTSVVVRGPATEILGLEELMRVEGMVKPFDEGDKRRYLRISPEEISGRRLH